MTGRVWLVTGAAVATLIAPAAASRAHAQDVAAFAALQATPQVPVAKRPGAARDPERLQAIRERQAERQAERAYDVARRSIEQNRYDRALEGFDEVIAMKVGPVPAGLYWKAYSQAKLARAADALETLRSLQAQFPDSPWVKDARALDVELRQSGGQSVAADAQGGDEELKLLALRGLMQSDPDTALPVLEQMLAGNNSVRVKERALFVLTQSRSPRARQVILTMARGSNPELQLAAIRYLGMFGGAESTQALDDLYRAAADLSVKRAIVRGYAMAGARERLLVLARTDATPAVRGDAIQQLGVIGAGNELEELYKAETDVDVKKRILNAMVTGGRLDPVIAVARSDSDPELRRVAIRTLGLAGKRQETAAVLSSIYASDAPDEVRKAVVEAMFLQNDASGLVALARAEKNPAMRKTIVQRLSVMRSPEATAYLVELLK